MDRKWNLDRIRLELYNLIDRRLVAIEAAIPGIGTIAAIDVTVSPTVDLISTNVQAALEELQAEILAISGGTLTGAGAATQVSFWTTPTNLSGEALFQWDPVNKRLGVNSTIPAQTLDVRGIARITGSSGTATSLMGRDVNGDVSAITVGSGLSLAGNTLTATGGSSSYVYSVVLGNVTTQTVLASTHGIPVVATVMLLDPSGNEVSVDTNIISGDVTISSNISLLNYTLIIGGGTPTAYTQTLPAGLTHTIVYSTHNISPVKSVMVLDPTGYVVSTETLIVSNDVTVTSNLSLLNHIIIIS